MGKPIVQHYNTLWSFAGTKLNFRCYNQIFIRNLITHL